MTKVHKLKGAAVFLIALGVVAAAGTVYFDSDVQTTAFATEEMDEETQTAQAVHEAVDGFLEAFINQDGANAGEGGSEKYREGLEPYVSEELLSKLAPTSEEAAEMYGEEYLEEVPEDQKADMNEYSRELAERQIFIHYESLNSKKKRRFCDSVYDQPSQRPDVDIRFACAGAFGIGGGRRCMGG